MAGEADAAGGLKGWEANIRALSTILTFLVGLPSLIYTINSQANARAVAFDNALQEKENSVKRVYDLLFSGLSEYEGDKANLSARAKIEAVCIYILREPTDLSNYPLGLLTPSVDTPKHVDAAQRLNDLQFGVRKILNNNAGIIGSIDSCRNYIQTEAASATERRARTDTAAAPANPAAPAIAAPQITAAAYEQTVQKVVADQKLLTANPQLNPATQPASLTLSAGRRDGWDIDVFWCEGPGAASNLPQANDVARRLASPAYSAARDAVLIGRVRLRMLPIVRQRDPGYRPLGLEVRGEAGEGPTAQKIAASLSGTGGQFQYRPSTQVTPWYLSVFVCQPQSAGD
ncbi:MAG: hypothetical protein WCO11_11560 [Sphingomonadales bacterium]